jgi:hypothetical protein
MFEFNLFDALDNPPTPTAADYQGSSGLDRLDEDLDSPAVVDAISSTPGLVDTILSSIATEFLGGDPPTSCSGPDAPQAAILYADLALKTSEGEELVNNIAAVVLDIQNQISGTSTVAEILAAIIPPEALASEATFTAMVEALLAANTVYLLLGAYVDGATSDGVHENDLPPGSLPGDVAQKAIVAYIMQKTVDAVVPVSVPATEAQAIAELFKVANQTTSPATTVTPDPFDSEAPFDGLPGPDYGILALCDLAGLSL